MIDYQDLPPEAWALRQTLKKTIGDYINYLREHGVPIAAAFEAVPIIPDDLPAVVAREARQILAEVLACQQGH